MTTAVRAGSASDRAGPPAAGPRHRPPRERTRIGEHRGAVPGPPRRVALLDGGKPDADSPAPRDDPAPAQGEDGDESETDDGEDDRPCAHGERIRLTYARRRTLHVMSSSDRAPRLPRVFRERRGLLLAIVVLVIAVVAGASLTSAKDHAVRDSVAPVEWRGALDGAAPGSEMRIRLQRDGTAEVVDAPRGDVTRQDRDEAGRTATAAGTSASRPRGRASTPGPPPGRSSASGGSGCSSTIRRSSCARARAARCCATPTGTARACPSAARTARAGGSRASTEHGPPRPGP